MDRPHAEDYYELTGNFKTVTGEDVFELNKERYLEDLKVYSKEIAEKYVDLVVRYGQMVHERNVLKKENEDYEKIVSQIKEDKMKPYEVLEDKKFYTIYNILDWLDEQIKDCGENSEWKEHFQFVRNEIVGKEADILREYYK